MKFSFRTALMRSIRGYREENRTGRVDASAWKSHDIRAASSSKLELELIQTQMAQKPVLRAGVYPRAELELELIQTEMAQKPVRRAEGYARALRASQNVKRAEVWVGARCA
jgi:hypothetical protein